MTQHLEPVEVEVSPPLRPVAPLLCTKVMKEQMIFVSRCAEIFIVIDAFKHVSVKFESESQGSDDGITFFDSIGFYFFQFNGNILMMLV